MKNHASRLNDIRIEEQEKIVVNKAMKFSPSHVVNSNLNNTMKGNTFNETRMDAVTCHPGRLLGMKGLFPRLLEILLTAPSCQPFLGRALAEQRAILPKAVPLFVPACIHHILVSSEPPCIHHWSAQRNKG